MLMQLKRWRGARFFVGAMSVLTMAGCATQKNHAPVEERNATGRTPATIATPAAPGSVPAVEAGKPLPGAENLGKPGYYAVKPGDTMIRIGLETGQNWKDLVKWNNLDNPNLIEVGQVLRVVAPGSDPGAAMTRPVGAKAEPRAVEAKPAASGVTATSAPASAAVTTVAAPPPAAVREGDDDVNWMWPAAGAVVLPFEEGKAKGLVIAGKAGDPVLAAADGRVVYAGSGLRGYGNLVILKHNNTYLTAYAHNQTLLVKEDQAVRRGQRIAEMGATDAERVQLHFEIRKQGKPVDPARLLPPR
jgi:lipoprotein NlpD